MSTTRVKKVKRQLSFTSTWTTNTLTVTCASHGLLTGDVVSLSFNDSPQRLSGSVTVVDANTFTIPSPVSISSGLVNLDFTHTTGLYGFSLGTSSGSPALIQANVEGTGAVTATIAFSVSMDGMNYLPTPFATISLNGTTSACDGFQAVARWPYWTANISAISGTNAKVTILVGE